MKHDLNKIIEIEFNVKEESSNTIEEVVEMVKIYMNPANVCNRTEAKEVAEPPQQEDIQGKEVHEVALCKVEVTNRFKAL